MDKEIILSKLREKGLRATPQRIEIYKYLYEHPEHPDVETIYAQVIKNNPSFSRTTVYNTLESLEKSGLIIPITIDTTRIHYDADINTHGHFFCSKCKKIFDFDVDRILCDQMNNFEINRKDVYYSGICPECKI